MKNQIKLHRCAKCKNDYTEPLRFVVYNWCPNCQDMTETEIYTREKKTISGDFTIVDWFPTKTSACFVIADHDGNRYNVYISDLFKLLEGKQLKEITMQEVKKGEVIGWKIID